MLDVILQLLTVLGIGLLIVLGLALFALLLVLFFPVAYRASGHAQGKEVTASVKAVWLFGLFRLRYAYPAQGQNGVKFLWMTLFDLNGGGKEKNADGGQPGHGELKGERPGAEKPDAEKPDAPKAPDGNSPHSGKEAPSGEACAGEEKGKADEGASWLSQKRKKFQYTICGVYDKISGIWQNISYYAALLQERETRELFSHVKKRLWRILKSIRPRKLKARVRFGAGAPDTTGYVFGIYGMLMPLFGPGVTVLPDFEQAVFEAEFSAAGRMTVAAFARNILGVLLDKRLWKFKNKLFAGAGKRGNGGKNGR